MKLLITVMMIFITATAYARRESLCQRAYRSDSVGLGIYQGFTGEFSEPLKIHRACFEIGVMKGNELKIDGGMSCPRDFESGFKEGFVNSWYGIGTECYNAGYAAGLAMLGTTAREGRAEEKCQSEYDRGLTEGLDGKGSTPSMDDRRLSHCYMSGFADSDPRNEEF